MAIAVANVLMDLPGDDRRPPSGTPYGAVHVPRLTPLTAGDVGRRPSTCSVEDLTDIHSPAEISITCTGSAERADPGLEGIGMWFLDAIAIRNRRYSWICSLRGE